MVAAHSPAPDRDGVHVVWILWVVTCVTASAWMYAGFRGWEPFLPGLASVATITLFSCGFVFSFWCAVWTVAIGVAAEILRGRWRRRTARGLCGACAYVVDGVDRCPECGEPVGDVPEFVERFERRYALRPMSVAIGVLGLAALLGGLVGEAWVRADELAFVHEARAAPASAAYQRPRAWPNESSQLVRNPDGTFYATD